MPIKPSKQSIVMRTGGGLVAHFAGQDAIQQARITNLGAPMTSYKTAPIPFTAGQSIVIKHNLGRIPTEYAVVWNTGGYNGTLVTAWDKSTVTIQSQAACTLTFRFW